VTERYEDIRFSLEDGVAVITLHRPDKRNAFSARMGAELVDAYRSCDADDDVRVVVLTGAPPAFCAGADLTPAGNTFAAPTSATFSAAAIEFPAWRVRKPVLAAVNGHAIGLGLTLALQCDLRIVAEDAKYGVVQVRRGVMPDAYSHWTLPRLVGLAAAADILLTGRTFDGCEAKELGVASRCLPAAGVLPATLELARDIAVNTAPLSVAISKRLLWQSFGLTPADAERLETDLHRELMGRADAREGALAFLERRAPAWESKVSTDWPDWHEGEPW
jgi:enoyl-CoA hydratase/carnithine racemase